MNETVLRLLDAGFFELKFAFDGVADEHVWKRPAPGLLSIGEIAGHMAYWEAVRLAGEGDDLAKCRLSSPLIDARFRYHTTSLATSPSEEHLAMRASSIYEELLRLHREAIADFKKLDPSLDTHIPGCPTGFTYGEYLEYAVFHTAYHTGQIYSIRHLLGEETPDN